MRLRRGLWELEAIPPGFLVGCFGGKKSSCKPQIDKKGRKKEKGRFCCDIGVGCFLSLKEISAPDQESLTLLLRYVLCIFAVPLICTRVVP